MVCVHVLLQHRHSLSPAASFASFISFRSLYQQQQQPVHKVNVEVETPFLKRESAFLRATAIEETFLALLKQ
jgi:hypothetical protein